jgi:dephospho-CoA kinase
MLKVALTGGIGSGKSLVGEYLEELGAVVIDSDELARSVIERGSPGYEEVLAVFGDEILSEGEIDRKKLAARVFSDEPARKQLEAIIHPRVRETAEKLTRNLGADAIVVNQIPLLFETDGAKRFDYVITVECAEGTRVERLKERGMKEYEISTRMQAQASDEQRASIADFVLKNEGSIDQLQREVQKMWESQLLPRIAKQ